MSLANFFFFHCFKGPINQEMRNLIQSLQKHNQQLKAESSRNRRRYKETLTELNKVGWQSKQQAGN